MLLKGTAVVKSFRPHSLVALLLLGAMLAACGGGDDGPQYPKEVRDNFLTSCTDAGLPKRQCRCVLDGVEKEFTVEEFVALEQDLSRLSQLPELQAIALKCVGE